MKHIIPILFAIIICLAGPAAFAAEPRYTQIDQDTAKEMMTYDDDHMKNLSGTIRVEKVE